MADTNWSVRVGARVTDDIQQQLNKFGIKTVTITPVLKGNQEFQRTATQFVDGTGQMVQVTKDLNKATGTVSESITKVKQSTQAVSKEIQETSKHTATLGEKFVDVTKKVVAFGAVTSIIGLFTKVISQSVVEVKELDASLTELQKVTDLGGDGLKKYTEEAFVMARELKTSASDVTDAITEFAKSNYTLEESQVLARQAIIFQTIADGAITASDSATMLIQVMKAYNMTVAESEHIVNSINEVSNQYALSSSDLSNSIGKVASSAQTAGVDFEYLIGLMTAGTEVTQNASKTANGLKSILVNLMSDKFAKQFEEFGISMRNANGEMKNGYELLKELSVAYNDMEKVSDETGESLITTSENMNALLEDIGGKYNINTLTAVLGNFDNAINATESAFNSANSASDEYAIAMDSIAKKADGVAGAFQELAWGSGGLSSFIKLMLDSITGILEFTNKTGLLKVILLDIGIILTATLIPKLITFGSTILANIGYLALFTAETGSLALGLKAVGISASVAQIALGGVVAVLTIGAMAWNGYKSAQEEAERATKESISSTLSEIESLEQISKQLEDETLTREALYSLIKGTDAYSSEMEDLEDVNELRQKAIDKIKEEQNLRAKQLVDTGLTSYQQAQSNQSQDGSDFEYTPYSEIEQGFFDAINNASGTQAQIEAISNYKEELIKLRGEYAEGTFNYKQYTKEISNAEAELSNLYARQQEDNALISDFNNALSILGKKYDEVTGEIVDLTQAEIDNTNKTKESSESVAVSVKNTEELVQAYSELSDASNSVSSEISNINSALSEQVENEGLSLETQLGLIESGYALALSYDEQTGAVTLNEEAIRTLIKAKIENLIQDAQILQSDIQSKLKDDGIVALKSAEGFLSLAMSKNLASSETSDLVGQYNDAQSTINALQSQIKNLDKSFSVATTSTRKQTKAIDKQKEALDKLKDEYKAVTEYIKDQLESEISRIEDAKSAELDRIDSTIDALNKKRDAEEEYWDNRISALEAQNDATEKQIELEQLQENLALARNKKVMVMGANGWEVRSDEQAVAQAEQDIADYTRQQQAQIEIDILNKLKETALANYDSQIQAQEDFKTKQESAFDAQIQVLEGYKTEYNNMINAYDEDQNRLMALQVLGTDFEAQTWQTRLANLQDYVNRYNTLQASLSGSVANTSSGGETPVKTSSSVPKAKVVAKVTGVKSLGSKTRAYASGVSSVRDDEVAMVGDNPNNRELVIGGKLNGTATKLTSGSGVVNADAMKTWAGIMNNLGSNNLMSKAMGGNITNSNTSAQSSITIGNITLPSVTNARSFVDELNSMSFSRNMLQQAYSTT